MKKALLTILQCLLTIGLLWFVFRDADKRQALHSAVTQAEGKWLLYGILAYGIFEIFAGIRWQILLRVQGIYISWWRLYGLLMVGLFFSLFIPGGTGGDLVKAYYLLKEAPDGKKTAGVISILMDRLVGLLAVALLTALVIYFRWDWLTSMESSRRFVLLSIVVLGVCLCGVIFAGLISAFHLAAKLPPRFPFREGLLNIMVAFKLYGRSWVATSAALIISIVAHGAHYSTFWMATRAIDQSGPRAPDALELYSVLPVIETIAALPFTPGGLGTREAVFDEMLTSLGELSQGVAASISMIGYACIAFWGVLGGLLYLFYRPTRSQRVAIIAETKAQIHQRGSAEADELLTH